MTYFQKSQILPSTAPQGVCHTNIWLPATPLSAGNLLTYIYTWKRNYSDFICVGRAKQLYSLAIFFITSCTEPCLYRYHVSCCLTRSVKYEWSDWWWRWYFQGQPWRRHWFLFPTGWPVGSAWEQTPEQHSSGETSPAIDSHLSIIAALTSKEGAAPLGRDTQSGPHSSSEKVRGPPSSSNVRCICLRKSKWRLEVVADPSLQVLFLNPHRVARAGPLFFLRKFLTVLLIRNK